MNKAKEERAAQIFKRVLAGIKPDKAETQATIANVNMLTARLRKIVPKSVEIMVVGSIARSTNLKGDADIDIFMLFDKSYSKERLSGIGLDYGKRLVNKADGERFEIKYAEHPYVRAYLRSGLRADIVPASKIENVESLATAVDRTPLHTEFINESLSERQRDDTRLLKYLLKAHGIYGAEIKTGGFSGYLCELLIYQHGSLIRLMEKMAELKLPAVMDPKNRTIMADEKLAKKFGKRFVVIDPVDQNRNVAAAVTEESLARFVLVSREFVSRPDIGLFYKYGFSASKSGKILDNFMRMSGLDFFLMAIGVPDKSSDVVWPQLKKATLQMAEYIKANGFETYLALPWLEGRKGLILIVAPKSRVKTRLMKGPDVFKTTTTGTFIKKHDDAFGFVLKESTLYALEEGRHSDIEGIMKAIASGGIMKRHKDISFRGARLFVNEIPKEYTDGFYLELGKALRF